MADRVADLQAPIRPGFAGIARQDGHAVGAEDFSTLRAGGNDGEEGFVRPGAHEDIGAAQRTLRGICRGIGGGELSGVRQHELVDLRSGNLRLPGQPTILRVQHHAVIAGGPANLRRGEGDAGQGNAYRHLGLMPALAVIIRIDDDAMFADRDQARPGISNADEQDVLRQANGYCRFGEKRERVCFRKARSRHGDQENKWKAEKFFVGEPAALQHPEPSFKKFFVSCVQKRNTSLAFHSVFQTFSTKLPRPWPVAPDRSPEWARSFPVCCRARCPMGR